MKQLERRKKILHEFAKNPILDDETYIKADFKQMPGNEYYSEREGRPVSDDVKKKKLTSSLRSIWYGKLCAHVANHRPFSCVRELWRAISTWKSACRKDCWCSIKTMIRHQYSVPIWRRSTTLVRWWTAMSRIILLLYPRLIILQTHRRFETSRNIGETWRQFSSRNSQLLKTYNH